MPSSTLTTKGQITLPKEIRLHLHVTAGDRIDFLVGVDGQVTVRPARSRLKELRGMLHVPGRRPVTLEQMDAAIAREHRERR
jgi:AbrB family looped-hinge helix DNA binding protein